MKAGPVIDAFFRRQAPFSHKKPGEFRDAFAIGRLREWADSSGQAVHAISKDGDFRAACDGKILVHKDSIGDALAILFEGDALAHSTLALLARSLDNIQELVGENLDRRYFRIADDWDADIEDQRLVGFEILNCEVIDVLDDSVLVEASARAGIELDATVHDYDNSPRDTGDYAFLYTNKIRYTSSFDVRLELTVRLEGEPPIPVALDDVSIVEPKTFQFGDDAERETLESWSDEDEAING